MNIGFCTSSMSRVGGGVSTAASDLSHALLRCGKTSVHVYAARDGQSDADLAVWDGCNVHVFRTWGPKKLAYAPGFVHDMRGSRLDLVHCHGLWTYPSVACSRWAAQTGGPYIVAPHGMLDTWALGNSRWRKRLAGWLFQDDHLKRSSCFHALCEAEARAIRSLGFRNPIFVIPNGTRLPHDDIGVSVSWGERLPEGAKVLLFLGRLHPKKGLPSLLRGWASAVSRDRSAAEPWRLVLAGWDQGGHAAELHVLCRDLGLERSVVFVGPQFGSAKGATFSRADAFVLPSLSEGLPVAILEAWAHKLPVVMTAECNLSDGFDAGAAIRVAANTESISSGLLDLFRMPDSARHEMGIRGRALVQSRFSWPSIADRIYAVYLWMTGSGTLPDTRWA